MLKLQGKLQHFIALWQFFQLGSMKKKIFFLVWIPSVYSLNLSKFYLLQLKATVLDQEKTKNFQCDFLYLLGQQQFKKKVFGYILYMQLANKTATSRQRHAKPKKFTRKRCYDLKLISFITHSCKQKVVAEITMHINKVFQQASHAQINFQQ